MNKGSKLTDSQFFAILRENGALYARTARAIKKEFNITITRQAVRQRAENNPEELADILDENIDVAEEGLFSLMRSKNESVRLKAVELFLKTKGKKRGYVERSEIDHTTLGKSLHKELDLSKLSKKELEELERITSKLSDKG